MKEGCMLHSLFIHLCIIKTVLFDFNVSNLSHGEITDIMNRFNSSRFYREFRGDEFCQQILIRYKANPESININDIYLRSCVFNIEVFQKVMNSIFDKKYEEWLLKLIFDSKCEYESSISNYSIVSLSVSRVIKDVIYISSNEKLILDNKERWNEAISNYLSPTIYAFTSSRTKREDDDFFFLKNAWLSSIWYNNKVFIRRFNLMLDLLAPRLGLSDNLSRANLYIETPFLKTRLFNILQMEMEYIQLNDEHPYMYYYDSFSEEKQNTFYLLFNYNGFHTNRICNHGILNLYIGNNYKDFRNHKNFISTKRFDEPIDLSYLEGKKINLETKEEFEFFVGLLQYYSDSFKKHIICSIEKGSYNIEIIKASIPPCKEILDYYQRINDITSKVLENIENYENLHFTSIVEGKHYKFKEESGDTKVFTRCLVLSCNHIIGNELLYEFYDNFMKKCFYCNINVRVVSYFEVDLYRSNI